MDKVKESDKFTKEVNQKPLRTRRKKEILVANWLDWHTLNGRDINDCGIVNRLEYVEEPYLYYNIIEAFKWCKQYLEPLLDEYRSIKKMYTPEQWQRLYKIDKNHEDLKDFSKARAAVKAMWYKRPRFRQDIGRVEKHGY